MNNTTNTGIETDSFNNRRCLECQRFVSESDIAKGRTIKHANYCESKAQPVETKSQPISLLDKVVANRRAIREGAVSAVLSDDEIVTAARLGFISGDDAMNRDF